MHTVLLGQAHKRAMMLEPVLVRKEKVYIIERVFADLAVIAIRGNAGGQDGCLAGEGALSWHNGEVQEVYAVSMQPLSKLLRQILGPQQLLGPPIHLSPHCMQF